MNIPLDELRAHLDRKLKSLEDRCDHLAGQNKDLHEIIGLLKEAGEATLEASKATLEASKANTDGIVTLKEIAEIHQKAFGELGKLVSPPDP